MECGAEVQNSSGGMKKSYSAAGKPGKRLKWIIPLAAVLIVVIIVIFAATGSNGYKKPIDSYFKAIETQNIKYLYKAYAQYWQNEYVGFTGGEGFLEECFEEDIEDELHEYGCGDKVKIKYTINRVRKANRSELEEVKDDLYSFDHEEFDYDRDNVDKIIKAAVTVDVAYTVTGPEDIESYTITWLVVKEKGDWRIHRGGYMDNSFFEL